ncbi:MAG: PAS domain S-box protein [Porticoccaceae bacterium]|nr:PAS domain S-box protein [Porticoccaceae bacterium]
MTRLATALMPLLLVVSESSHAFIIQYFKDEEGRTNWQYVANFSSSLLILILSGVAIKLFLTYHRLRKTNRALRDIRNALEVRVEERTATLNESNRLLKETNKLLEKEVRHHQETTAKLRQSEAYIKNILESMPLMLIGINQDGTISQWNRKAEQTTGISTDSALHKNLWDTYPAITVSRQQVDQAIRLNKPVTIKHSQRGRYHFDIIIYPLHEQGETSVVILVEDVTQRILTENMLIQRDKMSSMGELASTMAQDINAPLQAILADVRDIQNFLASNPMDDEGAAIADNLAKLKNLLDDASKKGENASAIIDNLLDFSRTQDGEKRTADVAELMEKAIRLARDTISLPGKLNFRDIDIHRDYESPLPAIPCYPAELQQVFLSLFRHSCHALGKMHLPSHKPQINIQIMECYDALWIKIQHNGVGLTLDEQKYIFEPFFNNPADLDDPSKRLSFSYFIITEHHRGQMAVTSDVDVGSTFHMQIQLS